MESGTWHYGVVAQWWAEFNVDGPEVPYFQEKIQRYGEPALDVACGTGRLLLPYRRAGLDVDGTDVSADMLAHCRALAARDGLTVALYRQAMHELGLPRRYRTIYVCGGFGLGGVREHDALALRRFHDHLEPGGTLVLDHHVPYADAYRWRCWLKEERRRLPGELAAPEPARTAADGSRLGLNARITDLDPLTQVITNEMHARRWRDGRLEADERYVLKEVLYLPAELRLMLRVAGFVDVHVEEGYSGTQPTADSDVLVLIARKPE